MATLSTTAMLHAKCLSMSSPSNHLKSTTKPATMRSISLQNLLPKGLFIGSNGSNMSSSTSAAIAGVIFSSLSSSDAAFAAQQIADIAEGDNRGLALLIPIVPAIAWVLYNILQPALNQINKMRSDKGFILGVGLGAGLAAGAIMSVPTASAGEIVMVADASSSSSDSRGLLLLFVVAPAILWVLYNILQPALNQINRMRSS